MYAGGGDEEDNVSKIHLYFKNKSFPQDENEYIEFCFVPQGEFKQKSSFVV